MAQETPITPVDANGRLPQQAPAAPAPQDNNPGIVTSVVYNVPPHSGNTKSTLSPLSEFARIFLLVWSIRYIPRGFLSEAFHPRTFDFIKIPVNNFIRRMPLSSWAKNVNKVLAENAEELKIAQDKVKAGGTIVEGHLGQPNYLNTPLLSGLRKSIRQWRAGGGSGSEAEDIIRNVKWENGVPKLGEASIDKWHDLIRSRLYDMGYSLSLGVGSLWLSLSYSRYVRQDMHNIFREAVAYEKGIPQDKVTLSDIKNSDNIIVQSTFKNYRSQFWQRLAGDAMFFVITPLKSVGLTEIVLGGKGLQVFTETLNRKNTLFEDFVGLVNTKINPRNGLGQQITISEIVDIYQHYAEQYRPQDKFQNVLAHGAVEYDVWAKSQPVFQRVADLMNKSYAYKSAVRLDAGGKPIAPDNFTLPKFIYLLGHDMINPRDPRRMLAAVEIANKYGIDAVKEMQQILKSGATLEQVLQRYPVSLNVPVSAAPKVPDITATPAVEMPPERAPQSRIDVRSLVSDKPLALAPGQAQSSA